MVVFIGIYLVASLVAVVSVAAWSDRHESGK